jgi:hypothetical protein
MSRLRRVFSSGLDGLEQGRYALELLLEKRLWLFAVADIFLLFSALLSILGGGGKDYEIFVYVALLPFLLLAVPALSGVVALERRAGSLDLALAVPSTERYFVLRVVPVALFFILQAWLILVPSFETWGNLLRALFQSLEVMLLLVALVLFWAVRLRTSGAVLAASWVSVGLLSRWIFFDPTISRSGGAPERLFGLPLPVLEWAWNSLVLALATFILYQYARERLRRPEVLLS